MLFSRLVRPLAKLCSVASKNIMQILFEAKQEGIGKGRAFD